MGSSGLRRADDVSAAVQLRAVDIAILVFAMPALNLLLARRLDAGYLLLQTLAVVLFLFFAQVAGLYRSWRMQPLPVELGRVSFVWAAVLSTLLGLAFAFKVSATFSRLLLGTWAVLVPTLMAVWRLNLRQRNRINALRGTARRSIAFAGVSPAAHRIAEHIATATWMGASIAGAYDDRTPDRLSPGALELLGNTQDLLRDAREGKIDEVYVTLPMHAQARIVQIVNALADTTVSVYVVPDAFIFDMMHASWAEVGGYPVISIYSTPFFGVDGSLKRLEDLVLGTLILVLIAPLLVLIAIAIKLTSRGPVLFRQRRYGLNGQIVEVWKFRSMTVTEDGDKVMQARRGDARVTRLGAFLRRTSLDELPQFINVLQGHMSIVGPRPHAIAHNEEYRRLIHGYMLRHKVKPGITGWAQINGWRGETDTLEKMRKRVEYDLYYMRNWSLLFDVRIIFLTACRGFINKNAY